MGERGEEGRRGGKRRRRTRCTIVGVMNKICAWTLARSSRSQYRRLRQRIALHHIAAHVVPCHLTACYRELQYGIQYQISHISYHHTQCHVIPSIPLLPKEMTIKQRKTTCNKTWYKSQHPPDLKAVSTDPLSIMLSPAW